MNFDPCPVCGAEPDLSGHLHCRHHTDLGPARAGKFVPQEQLRLLTAARDLARAESARDDAYDIAFGSEDMDAGDEAWIVAEIAKEWHEDARTAFRELDDDDYHL